MVDMTEMVPLHDYLPLNQDLSSATEQTMISVLGRPEMPLTTADQPDRASPLVRSLQTTFRIGAVHATGIRPAAQSLQTALKACFSKFPEFETGLKSAGMLVVRLRRPTSGKPSQEISNHAWGTAIDFQWGDGPAIGSTGTNIPRYIATLLPFLHAEGWYSGIAFHDDMHFEVADETIRAWSRRGALKAE